MTRSIQDMIQQEVLCCMSSMVALIAQGTASRGDLGQFIEQAQELTYPVADYEKAAIQAGWHKSKNGFMWNGRDGAEDQFFASATHDWEALCWNHDLDPIDREVFEHWAVTDWLGARLSALGEKVDADFGGLTVWARTTTGQAIYADSVIEKIYADMMAA